MNFYISKIKLWFRNGEEPRIFEFLRDKVNVITGDSSTGKSSILKIIDYCLLADYCTIVQDIINENVSWYGLVFFVDDRLHTSIRKAPTLEQSEMCVIFREGEFLPDTEPEANLNDIRSKAMVRMNELFNVPAKLKLDSKVVLNFRHNLMFNYLTEDIIATENTYQDLRFFRNRDFGRILDDLFKMAIGVNEAKIRELEGELEKVNNTTAKKRKAQEKQYELVEAYEQNRKKIMEEMVSLDLCDASELGSTPEEWSQIMKTTVDNYNVQFSDVRKENKRKQLNEELRQLRENLGYFMSLKAEYEGYMKRLKIQSDSLVPIEFIEKHMSEIFRYHETSQLLGKLQEAWKAIRDNYTPEPKLPDNFEKRMQELQKEIDAKTCESKRLNPMQPENKNIQWISSVILLSEKITKELKKVPTITITDEDIIKLQEVETAIDERLRKLQTRNDNAIGELNYHINRYFRYQNGLSESYNDCKPVYSMGEHVLMLERDGTEYPIANVGSKSNYMFLHLCYFFGLHELLAKNNNKQIPRFLFIDQPSIPYYADRTDGDDQELRGGDEIKLLSAFRLIDRFMQEMIRDNRHFQIILIEHADPRYWEDQNELQSFKTCYQFRNNEGLIPSNAIKK